MKDMPETQGLVIVGEAECERLVGRKDAFDAVEAVFGAMAKGDAWNFPVVREAIGYADALYGFKSGFDKAGKVLGVKSGGYWPGNMDKELTNHQSTVFLFDPDTGQLAALVGGNYLTAVRTAASSAVSIAHLARKDAKVLGMVGAGHQSQFQLRAAAEQRDFEKVVAWNPHPEMLPKLGAVAEELGLPFEAVTQEQLGAQADVIITITSAFEPLLMKDWIKPGTHIACMGTDTKGKQEVDAALVAAATVFTDEVAQSISIGEAQHAIAEGFLTEDRITPIGAVINGAHPGRSSDDEITLFDGTGVGLQDLAVASVAARLAEEEGSAQRVSL
ncbi:ornithine cyclodeaminase [Mameliella alba]|uniref:iminosuccinate reductase BhcD n=1 Tax=Mameliella alba TaxID=561184 RepID=UPI0008806E52|nr:iminosuccinate reductase BhcD [Mameliella alba]OWV41008.1 ornithine cyclodeaminase [Mameliella alba]PTR33791.1 ornithine cyclodeaminase [Mameliella alba]GGF84956.1 ornithine cyclodeaminase [Mameliella alba]SDE28713.1 ornithine cyclodeaminase [Mameliella alba]